MRFGKFSRTRLTALVFLLSAGTIATAQNQPVDDPAPTPTASGLTLTLEEFATIPASSVPPAPTTRIVYLSEIPDGSGHLVVPDLNGKVWLLVNGQPIQFMDFKNEF